MTSVGTAYVFDLVDVADTGAAICLSLGALLTLIAAVGILRFPDVLTRMHSATKPQVLGLLLILAGSRGSGSVTQAASGCSPWWRCSRW